MRIRHRKSVRLASRGRRGKDSEPVRPTLEAIKTPKVRVLERIDFTDWHNVTVSARKILWPCLCACCGGDIGPVPDSEPILPNVHAVKMNVSTFEPFYCEQCREHQAKKHQAELLPAVKAPTADRSIYGVYAFGCIFSPCIIGLFMTIFEKFIKSSDLVFGASLVTLCLIVLIVHIKTIQRERQMLVAVQVESDSIENARKNLENEAKQLQLPTCTALMPTVKIAESHGSIHQFMFVDESLAKLFADLNAVKVVTRRVDIAPSSSEDLD